MLAQLIPELCEIVFSFLEVLDFLPLRLTCRHLEQASRRAFGAVAFSNLRVDFSKANLDLVTRISEHEQFRLVVREWHVRHWSGHSDAPATHPKAVPLGHEMEWRHREGGMSLDLDSNPAKRVVSLLSRFPNCTGVMIAKPMHSGKSYESKLPEGQCFRAEDAMELMLHALAAPRAPRISSFRMRMGQSRRQPHLASITEATIASARRTWAANLRELVIEQKSYSDEPLHLVLDLMTSATNLRVLRFVRPKEYTPNGAALVRRLQGPSFHPPLEALFLGDIHVAQPTLIQILSRFQSTLKTLDLRSVCLSEWTGSWPDVLTALQSMPLPQLYRFSIFACSHCVTEEVMLGLCPLWADPELQRSCGGTFEFGNDTSGGHRHITGALFISQEGPSQVKRAMQALVEGSHTFIHPCDGGDDSSCGDMAGLEDVAWVLHPNMYDSLKSWTRYERWTGLPPPFPPRCEQRRPTELSFEPPPVPEFRYPRPPIPGAVDERHVPNRFCVVEEDGIWTWVDRESGQTWPAEPLRGWW